MEPSTSTAAPDGCESDQAQTATLLTPADILHSMQNFDHSRNKGVLLQRHQQPWRAENLVELGSAVVKDFLSSSDTDVDGTLMALLPNLKPMIAECFAVGISRFISQLLQKISVQSPLLCCQESAVDVVEEFSQSVKTEVVEKSEEEHDTDADSADEKDDGQMESVPQYCLTEKDPHFRTKDVPPHILYSVRGVRCRLCWLLIKGSTAVDKLVNHTKEVHPEKATDSFLKLLRQKNAFDKVVGKGIRYCTCKRCQIFGMARFHKGFWKRSGC